MPDTNVIPGNLIVQGNLLVYGTKPTYARSELAQDDLARYKIPFTDWRVWDAFGTNLPATPASDDLGLVGGTFATASPTIQTGDLKAAGSTTRYARTTFQLPAEYVAGQTVTLRARAGMKTTIADVAATIDFQVYKSDDEEGISADLCTTAATTINNLTDAPKDFVITPTALSPGDTLDIRMAVLVNDAATATAVIGLVGGVEFLLDVKG